MITQFGHILGEEMFSRLLCPHGVQTQIFLWTQLQSIALLTLCKMCFSRDISHMEEASPFFLPLFLLPCSSHLQEKVRLPAIKRCQETTTI